MLGPSEKRLAMSSQDHVLAIDQGTTSTRAMVFDAAGGVAATAQRELPQVFPEPGWVEHEPEEIWQATLDVCRRAVAGVEGGWDRVAGIGITNQRETSVLWQRSDGCPLHNAIVWQDRRTAGYCRDLRDAGEADGIAERTGLVVDPYFSASKLTWLLDKVAGAREASERGELAFGTIDSFLLWRLTGGRVHATDATNASRTMLFDIHRQDWDDDLLALFRVPRSVLADVRDSAADFGSTDTEVFGRAIPIAAMAGDQQAATVGQACFQPGMIKSTYGTGCFVMLNTGVEAVASRNRLLTTVAYRLDGKTTYALEGSIFVAGAAVQWLRDGLGLIATAEETEALAGGGAAETSSEVVMVPAFTGLGAPYWDAEARGAILGLTRDTGIADVVRATLDSVCHQTGDLMRAMAADGAQPATLRVDGGMVANDWLMQRLADILEMPVERPEIMETTALGAAALAALQVGLVGSLDELAERWRRQRQFQPTMQAAERERLAAGWRDAVGRISSADPAP